MATTITATQAKTLRALVDLGGEVNWYARISGMDSRCQASLARNGLIEEIGTCECTFGEPCDREHGESPNGGYAPCVNRVRITDAGRAAACA